MADGVLDMYIHTEDGVHAVAAPVPLIHGRDGSLGQLYGRYAVRFRVESLHGYPDDVAGHVQIDWVAVWAWESPE